MPYNPPFSQQPQDTGPVGNMADWTPAGPWHSDQTANQQLQHMSQYQLPQEVWDSLIKQATAPDPTMPQPGPERPLSGWEATAAALHPQLLQQFRRDPTAAPQFQGQMAAFQQAMLGKRSAQERLTQMADTAQRGQTANDIAGLRDETTRRNQDLLNAFHTAMAGIAQQNANTKANPPAKPGKLKPFQTPSGPVWIDPENPDAPAIPVKGASGEDIPAKADPKIQGQINSLNEAIGYIKDMREKYRNVVKGSSMGAVGRGAKAELLGLPRWAGGDMTRAGVGYFDSDARQHEADRQALVFMMQKAETDQNRILQSVIEQVLQQIPSISESPAVAEPMYDKLDGIVKNALATYRAMPQAQGPGTANPGVGRQSASAPAAVDPAVLERARAIAERNRNK